MSYEESDGDRRLRIEIERRHELLSPDQVAKEWGVSRSWLDQHRSELQVLGVIFRYLGPRKLRVRRGEIEDAFDRLPGKPNSSQ